jgi:hypothetical protein
MPERAADTTPTPEADAGQEAEIVPAADSETKTGAPETPANA